MNLGSSIMTAQGETFSDLFWNTWKKLEYKLPNDPTICYMFEFCSTKIKTVVKHSKDGEKRKQNELNK